MVVHIVRDTRLATEKLGLLLSLEDLSASEQASGWNTVLNKTGIIGAAGEVTRNVREIILLVELLEVLLKNIGTSRAAEVECRPITIVNAKDVIRARNLARFCQPNLPVSSF